MDTFEFYQPTKLVFGPGKLAATGALAAAYGKKALVVCDPFFVTSGLAERLRGYLREAGLASAVYGQVIPNPTTDSIDAGAALARREDCDVIIGLGGGSAMDTAKAVAVGATHPGPIWPYAIGEQAVTAATLPIIAVTTTSGTGSQCTCFSVITNPQTNQKPGMGSPFILPRVAVIDPELMVSVPAGQSLITGFDVFCHAVEAYTSTLASPISDMYAERAVTLTVKHLPAVMQNGRDLEARCGMALADTCAGIAICNAVVSLGHVMAHVIGGHYHDIPHGDALYSIYRGVLTFNATVLPEKHAWLAQQLCPGCTDLVAAYDRFFAPFKFENRLKAHRPDAAMLDRLAADTFTYMKGCTDLNPRPATVADARAILQAAIA
jgi:alcohol dehydrogenase class IV